MMLKDFGMTAEAEHIEKAVDQCIDYKIVTEDINQEGDASLCSEVGMAICNLIKGEKLVV